MHCRFSGFDLFLEMQCTEVWPWMCWTMWMWPMSPYLWVTITELGTCKYSKNVLKVVKIVAMFFTFIQKIKMSCMKFFSDALFSDSFGNWYYSKHTILAHAAMHYYYAAKKNPQKTHRYMYLRYTYSVLSVRKVHFSLWIIRNKWKLLNYCSYISILCDSRFREI